MREHARSRHKEIIEDVVYTKQKIKHFDRNGSEYWAETNIPDLVEKTVEFDKVEYICEPCDERQTVKEEIE